MQLASVEGNRYKIYKNVLQLIVALREIADWYQTDISLQVTEISFLPAHLLPASSPSLKSIPDPTCNQICPELAASVGAGEDVHY